MFLGKIGTSLSYFFVQKLVRCWRFLFILWPLLCSCAGVLYGPGTKGTAPFTSDWSFGAATESQYIFDASKIDLSAGVAKLSAHDLSDNATTGFGSGIYSGAAEYDATNSFLRLGTNASNVELDPSWHPQWSDLVGYWPLNGVGSIGTATNIISATVGSSGATENPDGSDMAYTFGQLKQGIYFGGSDEKIDLGNQSSLNITGTQLSIAAWVNRTSSTKYMIPMSRRQGGLQYQLTWVRSNEGSGADNVIRLDLKLGGANVSFDGSVPHADTNSWHHIAATYDGQFVRVFFDGQKELEAPETRSIETVNVGNYIGTDNGSSFSEGVIDEVAVWNKALTSEAIANIYQHQASAYTGTYTSQVFDAFDSSKSWPELKWTTTLPFGKPLTYSEQSETQSAYPSLASNTLMTGNVGLWHLDEPEGTNGVGSIDDESGQGNHATPLGGVTFGRAAQLNTGAVFDGTTGFLQIANDPSFNFSRTQDFCVTTWVKIPKFQTDVGQFDNSIIEKWSNSGGYPFVIRVYNQTYGINPANRGKITANRYDQANGPSVLSLQPLNDDKFHHIVFCRGITAGNISLYVDGALQGSTVDTTTGTTDNSSDLYFGERGTSQNRFTGTIDEVAIWNRPLSESEIKQLYRRGANRLKFQVRSCQDALCATGSPPWLGPDGTSQSVFSELNNTLNNALIPFVLTSGPTMTFANFGSPLTTQLTQNRYFQYRALMESDDAHNLCVYNTVASPCSPELKTVELGPTLYDANTPSISNATGMDFTNLTSFSETLGPNGCVGGIRYHFSIDQSTWYYWSGSSWTESYTSFAESNPASDLTAEVMEKFATQVGTGKLYFRALFKSDASQACELDHISLGGTQ